RNAYDLAQMAKKYGVGLKEHNGDYLDDVTLLEHIPSQIIATNEPELLLSSGLLDSGLLLSGLLVESELLLSSGLLVLLQFLSL
ncbi:hypothetical protein ACTPEM_26030, partial [Clostridioides difficile]